MSQEILARYDRPVPRYTSYPTAPHFHDRVGRGTYERWLAEIPPKALLSLYLHIPYCDSLCWFCGCHTKITRRYEPVTRYLQSLYREIETVARLMPGKRTVQHIHWGGGSPTLLSPIDIEALGSQLRHHFKIAADAEFAVEIDPRDLTGREEGKSGGREIARALARAGVNRVSIGLQDVNPEVQAAINRIQPLGVTREAIAWLREEGINALNLDLIYGLPLQTVERVEANVEAALSLSPDRIAIFGYAHVPWMKKHQTRIAEDTLPGREERRAQFAAAAQRLKEAGYVPIGIDHFAKPDDGLARALAAGTLRRNFQGYTSDQAEALIGFGASAISALPQGYVQNAVPIKDYEDAVDKGQTAAVRGIELSDDDRLRRAIIERLMCEEKADIGALARRFQREAKIFSKEYDALQPMIRDGLLALDNDRIRIREGGKPLLRTICAVFDSYLQQGAGRYSRAV